MGGSGEREPGLSSPKLGELDGTITAVVVVPFDSLTLV